MSELLPCPFCGGKAHVFHVGDWWVEHACKKLGKYIGTRFCETEEEAAAWWNTRAERTCHIVKASRKYILSDGTELFEDGCSECNGYLGDGDNYCPNCGARVIA